MKKHILFITLVLALSSCVNKSTNAGTVGIERKQMFLVSAESMNAGAAAYYTQTLREASANKALNTNPIQTKKARDISKKLIRQVGVFREDALKWNWEVNVIDEKTVNAWCMPGGKIAVYSGIIQSLNATDGELAAIIGHEMAHALREHSRERASSEQVKNIGILAIGIVGGGELANLANLAAQYSIMLPFSRQHETEADTIGAELMARAGYNPDAAVSVWKKMSKLSKSSPFQFASTHPSHEERIKNLQEVAKKVKPLYLAAK